MTPDRWARVKEIFHSALERTPAERAEWLSAEAGHDPALLAEIERLLAAHEQAGSFIEQTPISGVAIAPLRRLGHYEIRSTLGAGAMGEVYRAHDTTLNREVAIKVLHLSVAADPGRLMRFGREAQLLAALNHPHIAAIYGVEDAGGTKALVLELVEGPTLAELIARGAIPIADALPIARQIADALDAAHEQGIVHRDLKPANIKVRPDGTVKVLDFGLAKALGPTAGESAVTLPTHSVTQAGMILGTAAYMSPEQARGAPVDRRADLWAFGAVLYEMLTGARAFTGATISDTLAAVLKTEPEWARLPDGTPTAIRRLLRRCLEKEPRQRLASAADARLDLQEALVAPSREVSVEPQRVRRVAWLALPWIAAAGFALALVFAVWSPRYGLPPATTPLRFQIQPPRGTTTAGMFTLSPNGRHLAFTASSAGSSRLWLRDLDSLEPRALPGTDDASYPFWSPDGGTIAFFARGKLKTISIDGGSLRTLCDAANARGGSWNRDGVIVFSPGPLSPLLRVSAAGGSTAAVTKLAPDDSSAGHRFPTFLPDGIHVLYEASSQKPEASGLYWTTIDGSASGRLRDEMTNAFFAPATTPGENGYLVFRHDNSLMAQPFDPSALKATGEMRPIAEGVPDDLNRGFGAFWASTNALIYRTGTTVIPNRILVWRDRAGKTGATVGQPAAYGQGLRLSPDDTMAAVGIFSGDPTYLWLLDVRHDRISRFTFRPGRNPVWSPDGKTLVFARQEITVTTTDVYRKAVARDDPETLVLNAGVNGMPYDWSPDGKRILFQRQDPKTGRDLWLLPLDGDGKAVPYLQTPANETLATYSPDGRWIAYQSDESGPAEIYVQAVPASGAKYQISSGGGTQPQWRRDGKELFFISADGSLMAVPISLGAHIDVGTPHALFSVVDASEYAASRDGTRFLMNVPKSNEAADARAVTITLNWLAGL